MDDGDIVTYKGKAHKVLNGKLVPVEERGPLGGVLQSLHEIPFDTPFYGRMIKRAYSDGFYSLNTYSEARTEQLIKVIEENFSITRRYKVETDVCEKRFTRTPLNEAVNIPDLAGRYLALKIDHVSDTGASVLVEGLGWLEKDEIILLENFYMGDCK